MRFLQRLLDRLSTKVSREVAPREAAPRDKPSQLAEQIRFSLVAALPPELHAHVPILAKLLSGIAAGQLDHECARAQLSAERGVALILQELAGRRIPTGDSLISFGYNNTIGDVTFGDVAGGHMVKVTVELPRPDVGTPFQVESLPQHYVARAEVFREVKQSLMVVGRDGGLLACDAIYGMGGSGKTTLAKALASDQEVLARYPDGVLWADLGQEPDPLPILGGWVQALQDYAYRPTSVPPTSSHLRSLLRDKSVLLVVDDVWDARDVDSTFKIGGPRCHILLTTRRAGVADRLGATRHELDTMTTEESLALLSSRMGRSLAGSERAAALRLADVVGRLPLALELARAQVSSGTATWASLAAALEAEIAQLEALENPSDRRRGTARLNASFHLSVKSLPDDDCRESFRWLGVLPEDVAVAAPMAATLWDKGEAEVSEILEILGDESLLLAGPSARIGEREWPTYKVHDLLHDFARRLLIASKESRRPGDLPGLGLSLPEANAALLERYRARTRDGLWHTLPDDGYIHAHLARHLELAGDEGGLRRLMMEETAEGRNGWYQTRDDLGQVAGYLTDLGRVWNQSERAYRERGEPGSLAEQWRYALMTSTLGSLAGGLPPALLGMLVQYDMWPAERALAVARQVPDLRQRAEAFSALAAHLSDDLRRDVWAEVKVLGDGKTTGSLDARKHGLVGIAPHLPVPLLPEALALAEDLGGEAQSEAIRVMLQRFPESMRPEMLVAAVNAALNSRAQSSMAEELTALAPLLPEELLFATAHASAQHGLAEEFKLLLKSGLLLRLYDDDDPERGERVSELLKGLWDQGGEAFSRRNSGVKLLVNLAKYLTPPLWQQVWSQIQTLDEWCRADVMSGLADHLPDHLRLDALAASKSIEYENKRFELLICLLPYLPEPERTRTLREASLLVRDLSTITHSVLGPSPRIEALLRLAPYLLAEERSEALRECLMLSRMISDNRPRAIACAALASKLSVPERDQVVSEALAVAGAIPDWDDQAQAMLELVRRLPEVPVQVALVATREMPNIWARVSILKELAPRLSDGQRDEVLRTALALWEKRARVEALCGLAPYLSDTDREHAVREARSSLLAIDEGWRAFIFGPFVAVLPETMLAEALEIAGSIHDPDGRSQAILYVAGAMPEPGRSQALHEAVNAARNIENGGRRVTLLTACASELSPSERDSIVAEALEAAEGIEREWHRADAYALLAPLLPEAGLREVWDRVRNLRDEQARANGLSRMAPHLTPPLLAEAVAVCREMGDEFSRADALAGLARHLAGSLLDEAWAVAKALRDDRPRANVLKGMGPCLPESVLGEAWDLARSIEDESARADTYRNLAPTFGKLRVSEIFPRWCEMLHGLSTRPRETLLENHDLLFMAIERLGGPGVMFEVFRALHDVGRWWP